MLQAIIFDMDGVIVDTEYLEFSLQKQFIEDIKEHSRPITLEQQSEVVGKCLKEIPVIIKKLSESSLPIEEIRARYYAFFQICLAKWILKPFSEPIFSKLFNLPSRIKLSLRLPLLPPFRILKIFSRFAALKTNLI